MSKRRMRNVTALAVDNTINFREYVQQQKVNKTVHLIPKSLNQELYIEKLLDDSKYIVFATGPAGTGKTMLAVLAGIKAFKEGKVEKIILTRPATGTDDEKFGYLPGDLNEKYEPWMIPLMDVLHQYYNTRDLARMLEEKTIELAPLAFQRGRTFEKSWIIFDESQNSSVNQMKMLLTRAGHGSKIVVTGDLHQTDRQFSKTSGLVDILSRIKTTGNAAFSHVEFSFKDVQRSKVCAEVLKVYSDS